MENKFDTLNSLIGRVFEKGIFDDTEEYREEFLNTLIDKIIKAIRANEFRFNTSKPIVDPGKTSAYVFDKIEMIFKMKSFKFPAYSAKEFVKDAYTDIADNGLNLVEYLEEKLTEALDCDKVVIWMDLRPEDKRTRDIKGIAYKRRMIVVLCKKRMVPVPEKTTPTKVEKIKPLPVKAEEKLIKDISAKELRYDRATTEKLLLSGDEIAPSRQIEAIRADASIKDNTTKDCLVYSKDIHKHLTTRVASITLEDTTPAYIQVPGLCEPIPLLGINHMTEHLWLIEAYTGEYNIPDPEAEGANSIDDILAVDKKDTYRYGWVTKTHPMIVDYKTLERISSINIPDNMMIFRLTRTLKSGKEVKLHYAMSNEVIDHDEDNDRIVIKTILYPAFN